MEGEPAKRQLELVARIAGLEPAIAFFGGFAEDAVLAGTVTRPHEDVDLLVPRGELERRHAQLAELGLHEWETWGEAEPGVPFFIHAENDEVKIDLVITDEIDGGILDPSRPADGHGRRRAGARRPTTGCDCRTTLFEQAPRELDGVVLKPISPLAMYQMRSGMARMNTLGPLSERHLSTMAELRRRFFPDRSGHSCCRRAGSCR